MTIRDALQRLLLAASLLVLAACPGPSPAPQQRKRLRIAHAAQPAFALVYLADEKGFFAEEGLDVSFEPFTSGRDALDSVLAGKADVATAFETPIALRVCEGRDLVVLTMLNESTRNHGVVVRKTAGIAGPGDLKGKKVALTRDTGGEYCLAVLLRSHGLRLSEVTVVATPPDEIVSRLEGGQVDAVATWQPHLDAASRFENVGVLYADLYTAFVALACRREFAAEDPDRLQRLLRGIHRAEVYFEENPLEARSLVLDRLGLTDEKNWTGLRDPSEFTLKITNLMLTVLEQEAAWLKETGKVSREAPDFREALLTEPLRRVKPSGVTLVKIR